MFSKTDVVIIGAGQAGLAMSRCLTDLDIDHIVLDRGAVGQRWRAERWASLRLLSPNWMTRLPGWSYDGTDPNGYMHKDEVVGFLNRYARSFAAPIIENTKVEQVRAAPGGYNVRTSRGTYVCRAVVVATGACDRPSVPGFSRHLPRSIEQVTTNRYVHAGQLDSGGVLVVGASATGIQLAEEIQASGRQVTLAVGSHVPLPRRYRGRDVLGWLDSCGVLAEERDDRLSTDRAMRQPSLQLIGETPSRDINLSTLDAMGVRCVGRLNGVENGTARLSDTLAEDVAAAGSRRERTLARIDHFIDSNDLNAPKTPSKDRRFVPAGAANSTIDLRAEGIRTIVWATGFRRNYPWLKVPVVTIRGEIVQNGGITPSAGLYTLGLPFMRRRNSTFIDGVGADAQDLSADIAAYLDASARKAA